jgi:hypothetical protein
MKNRFEELYSLNEELASLKTELDILFNGGQLYPRKSEDDIMTLLIRGTETPFKTDQENKFFNILKTDIINTLTSMIQLL